MVEAMLVEAVVFDVDGGLIDSEPGGEQVRRGVPAPPGGHWPDDAQDRMMGMSTGEWSAYMSADFGLPFPPGEVAELVIAQMTARYREHLPLLPGAVDAVRGLAATGRWRLAVASSAPQA